MHCTLLGLLLSAMISLVASAALPVYDLALPKSSHRHYSRTVRETTTDVDVSPHQLITRMDVLDPGVNLPGGGWTMQLGKFMAIVSATAGMIPQAQTELANLYQHSLDSLQNVGSATISKPFVLFEGPLLSFMVTQLSGTEAMTVDMLQAFCSKMLVSLAMGGYRGIYTVYLRQRGGPGMFEVNLASNSYWLSKGIGGLPQMIGLAAMGF